MFLVGILSWWYGSGWQQRIGIIRGRLARTSDYFSIGLLASTLFSPYRQISAGQVNGPIGVQLRAFGDRLISRIVGAVVRGFMILFGLSVICLQVLSGLVVLFFWIAIPLFPVVGLLATVIGWVPTWL